MYEGGKTQGRARSAGILPVTLANASGIIRGVSGTGIYFETEAEYMIGNKVDLTVELNTPTGRLPIQMPG